MKRRDRQLKVLARCEAAIAAQKRNDKLAAELQTTINATAEKMADAAKAAPDVLIANDFSVFVFTPLTPAAKQWVAENVQSESWQWLGASLVVETRYAWGLAEGMLADGLVLR